MLVGLVWWLVCMPMGICMGCTWQEQDMCCTTMHSTLPGTSISSAEPTSGISRGCAWLGTALCTSISGSPTQSCAHKAAQLLRGMLTEVTSATALQTRLPTDTEGHHHALRYVHGTDTPACVSRHAPSAQHRPTRSA